MKIRLSELFTEVKSTLHVDPAGQKPNTRLRPTMSAHSVLSFCAVIQGINELIDFLCQ